jgi:hypothetical protein
MDIETTTIKQFALDLPVATVDPLRQIEIEARLEYLSTFGDHYNVMRHLDRELRHLRMRPAAMCAPSRNAITGGKHEH